MVNFSDKMSYDKVVVLIKRKKSVIGHSGVVFCFVRGFYLDCTSSSGGYFGWEVDSHGS